MKLDTFHGKLVSQNIPISIEALSDYLKELGLDDVPQNMVNDLTADLKTKYATALELVDQGKGHLKGIEAPQVPSQASNPAPEVIDIPWEAQQAIASGADSMRSNVGSYIAQQETELSETQSLLVQYNRALEIRLWTGVGKELQSQGGPAFDMVKANREGWDKLKSSLKTAIANVNDFAGINKDAA